MNLSFSVVTSSDLIESNALRYQKSLAISARGLASFPYDNEEDIRLIRKVGRWRKNFEHAVLQLPNIPLHIHMDPLVSDNLLYYLALGDYEQSDLDLIEQVVQPGDKVMDIGGGAGVCAAYMAYRAQTPVIVVEAREDLHNLIERNLRLNALNGDIVHGVLADDLPEGQMVSFNSCENLWFSSLDGEEAGQKIEAPALNLNSLYNTYQPDVVLMDIEGAETRLNFNTTHKPRHLIVEIHTPSLGGFKTCEVIQNIIDCGYTVKNVLSQTWLFERKN